MTNVESQQKGAGTSGTRPQSQSEDAAKGKGRNGEVRSSSKDEENIQKLANEKNDKK